MKVINPGRLPGGGGGKGVGHTQSRGREFSCHLDGRGVGLESISARIVRTPWFVVRGCPPKVPFNVTNFTCCRTWSWAEGGRGGVSSARPAPSVQDRAGWASVAATAGPSQPEPETGHPAARGPGHLPGPGAPGSRDPGVLPGALGGRSGRTLPARHCPLGPGSRAPADREERPVRADTCGLAGPRPRSGGLRQGHVFLTWVPEPSASPASQTSGL